jgi:hypothetical protein
MLYYIVGIYFGIFLIFSIVDLFSLAINPVNEPKKRYLKMLRFNILWPMHILNKVRGK